MGGATGAISGGLVAAQDIARCPQGYQWGLELGEEAATRVEGIPITAPKEISKSIVGGAAVGAIIFAVPAVAYSI